MDKVSGFKWKWTETMFISERDALRKWFHDNDVYYELSGEPGFYHFEVWVNQEIQNKFDAWMDSREDIIREQRAV